MPTKPPKLWLVRDKDEHSHFYYGIWETEECPKMGDEGYWDRGKRAPFSGFLAELCPEDFERMYPHLKLEPGGGPVRVEVAIGRVGRGA